MLAVQCANRKMRLRHCTSHPTGVTRMSREYTSVVLQAAKIVADGCSCDRHCEDDEEASCGCLADAKKIVDLVLNTEFTEMPPETAG